MLMNTTTLALLPILLQARPVSHHEQNLVDPEPVARVEIVAFEASGRFLGRPNLSVFESVDHRNLAGKFRDGVATGIPYGVYRTEVRLPGYFSDVKYVRIYQAEATVVMGLRFGEELPRLRPVSAAVLSGFLRHRARHSSSLLASTRTFRLSRRSAATASSRLAVCHQVGFYSSWLAKMASSPTDH